MLLQDIAKLSANRVHFEFIQKILANEDEKIHIL